MRTGMRLVAMAAVVLGAGACGGSGSKGSTSNAVAGTVQGSSLNVQDAVFTTTPGGGGTPAAAILVADRTNLCADAQSYTVPSGASGMTILLGTQSGAVAPGSYVVYTGFGPQPPNYAIVQYSKRDGSCAETLDQAHATGLSGTVTIKSIDGSQAAGSFDVIIGIQGDHLSGNFDAGFCALPADFMTHPQGCQYGG